MKGLWIWLLGGLVALVAGFVGAAVFLIGRIDAAAELERAAEAQFGRDVTIAGETHVAYFPTLGFHAKDVRLANVQGGQAESLLAIAELQAGVAIRPLFDREVHVTRLVLVAPRLALEVDAAGAPNWLLKPAAPTTPSGSAPQVQEVRLKDVRIEDGAIAYANRVTGSSYALDAVDLQLTLDGLEAPLTLDGSARYREETVAFEAQVQRFMAALGGASTPIEASLTGQRLAARFDGVVEPGSGALSGRLAAEGPSLRRLSAWVGAPLGEGPGLESFRVEGALALEPKRVRMTEAALQLDGLSAKGDLAVATGGPRPRLEGALALAALDLNPYLAPSARTATVTIESVDVAAPGWSTARIDLSGLKAVDADLKVTSGPVTVQKVRIDGLSARVRLDAGLLSIQVEDMRLHGGTGASEVVLDARGPEVAFAQGLVLDGVDANAFLTQAVGLTVVEGKGRLAASLSAKGANQAALMRSLDGSARFALANGAVRGVNLGGVSRTIRDALTGEMIGPRARTPYQTFAATFSIADGVAATQDLRLKAAEAEITAVGVIDVSGRKLDLRITPRAQSILSRIGVAPGAGVGVPFRVSGPWDKIAYASDILGTAKPGIEAAASRVRANAPPDRTAARP